MRGQQDTCVVSACSDSFGKLRNRTIQGPARSILGLVTLVQLVLHVSSAAVEILINRAVEKTTLVNFIPNQVLKGASSLPTQFSPGSAYFHQKDLPAWAKVTSVPSSYDCPASASNLKLKTLLASISFKSSSDKTAFCAYSQVDGSTDIAKTCIAGDDRSFYSYNTDPQVQTMKLSGADCSNPLPAVALKAEMQPLLERVYCTKKDNTVVVYPSFAAEPKASDATNSIFVLTAGQMLEERFDEVPARQNYSGLYTWAKGSADNIFMLTRFVDGEHTEWLFGLKQLLVDSGIDAETFTNNKLVSFKLYPMRFVNESSYMFAALFERNLIMCASNITKEDQSIFNCSQAAFDIRPSGLKTLRAEFQDWMNPRQLVITYNSSTTGTWRDAVYTVDIREDSNSSILVQNLTRLADDKIWNRDDLMFRRVKPLQSARIQFTESGFLAIETENSGAESDFKPDLVQLRGSNWLIYAPGMLNALWLDADAILVIKTNGCVSIYPSENIALNLDLSQLAEVKESLPEIRYHNLKNVDEEVTLAIKFTSMISDVPTDWKFEPAFKGTVFNPVPSQPSKIQLDTTTIKGRLHSLASSTANILAVPLFKVVHYTLDADTKTLKRLINSISDADYSFDLATSTIYECSEFGRSLSAASIYSLCEKKVTLQNKVDTAGGWKLLSGAFGFRFGTVATVGLVTNTTGSFLRFSLASQLSEFSYTHELAKGDSPKDISFIHTACLQGETYIVFTYKNKDVGFAWARYESGGWLVVPRINKASTVKSVNFNVRHVPQDKTYFLDVLEISIISGQGQVEQYRMIGGSPLQVSPSNYLQDVATKSVVVNGGSIGSQSAWVDKNGQMAASNNKDSISYSFESKLPGISTQEIFSLMSPQTAAMAVFRKLSITDGKSKSGFHIIKEQPTDNDYSYSVNRNNLAQTFWESPLLAPTDTATYHTKNLKRQIKVTRADGAADTLLMDLQPTFYHTGTSELGKSVTISAKSLETSNKDVTETQATLTLTVEAAPSRKVADQPILLKDAKSANTYIPILPQHLLTVSLASKQKGTLRPSLSANPATKPVFSVSTTNPENDVYTFKTDAKEPVVITTDPYKAGRILNALTYLPSSTDDALHFVGVVVDNGLKAGFEIHRLNATSDDEDDRYPIRTAFRVADLEHEDAKLSLISFDWTAGTYGVMSSIRRSNNSRLYLYTTASKKAFLEVNNSFYTATATIVKRSNISKLATTTQHLVIFQSRDQVETIKFAVFDTKSCAYYQLESVQIPFKVGFTASACSFVSEQEVRCVFAGAALVQVFFNISFDAKNRPTKAEIRQNNGTAVFQNYQNLEVEQIVIPAQTTVDPNFFVVSGSRMNLVAQEPADSQSAADFTLYDSSIVLVYNTDYNTSNGFATGGLERQKLVTKNGESLLGKALLLQDEGRSLCLLDSCYDVSALPAIVLEAELPKQTPVSLKVLGASGEKFVELRLSGDNIPDKPTPNPDRSGTLKAVLIVLLIVGILIAGGVAFVYFRSRQNETLDPLMQNDVTASMVDIKSSVRSKSIQGTRKPFAEDEAPL